MTAIIQLGLGLAIALFGIGLVFERRLRMKRVAMLASSGAETPPSLYPRINAAACICSGNCVSVCPEKEVLVMIGVRPRLVQPAACVGHADCLRSCPTHAIELVLGSPERGVEVPSTDGRFQTTVPGLYVAGEVTGVGLIHNAVGQGRQAAKFALDSKPTAGTFETEIVIVGAGPAGLAAALEARHRRVRYRLFEKSTLGGAIRTYPRQKIVMTAPLELPGLGTRKLRRTSKEALVEMFAEAVRDAELEVTENAPVIAIRRLAGGFEVEATQGTVTTPRIVLAIGRRGVPRTLGVPGQDLAHVAYDLIDPGTHARESVVVVGGGDSAVEAALALVQARAKVTLVHRGSDFGRTKPDNRRAIEAARANGELDVELRAQITRVTPDHVELRDGNLIVASRVFCALGAELPAAWLRGIGIELRELRGEPLVRAS
ncbi:hypothetical protein BH11MYX1_BH11MYX1_41570 [soil metagenome]